MIFFVANDGTVIKTLPSPVYQGSSGANDVYLIAPFASNLTVTVAFQLPNGVYVPQAPMTPQQAISGIVDESTGTEYAGWSYALPNEITRYYGIVTAQFFFYSAQNKIVASSSTSFNVGRGVPAILPPTPSDDVYEKIYSAITQLQTDLDNGEYTSRSMQPWRESYYYGANEIVFYPNKGDYGTFVKSLSEDNNTSPYSDSEITSKWKEVCDFNVLNDLYDLKQEVQAGVESAQKSASAASDSALSAQSSANQAQDYASQAGSYAQELKDATDYLDGLKDGTVAVNKAINDGDGNNISEQFSEIFGKVSDINSKIPSTASADNQLADKAFVNSSINNSAAFYITSNAAGDAFSTRAALLSATTFYSGGSVRVPTQNDYAIVLADESQPVGADGSRPTTRYSYQTGSVGGSYPNGHWEFQYVVNNTSLTQAQADAINSGITSALVEKISDPSNTVPLMDGTAKAGSRTDYARGDHRHPHDTSKADVSNLPQFVQVTISTMGWTNNTAYSQTISGLTTDDFIQFVPDDASAETVIENNVRATGLATVVGGSSAQVIFQRDTVFVGSITGTILVIKAR